MARPPDTREDLRRALAVNAFTKPLNLLVPSLVIVAGSLLGTTLLIPVALVCWLGLAFVTFFDEEEASRVGRRRRAAVRAAQPPPAPVPEPRTPAVARRVEHAHAAAAAVREAVRESDLPLDDVTGEVDALVTLIERDAARADRMYRFLAEHPLPASAPEEQRRAQGRLEDRHRELLGELDRAASALDTVHAEVLAAEGLTDLEGRQALAGRVADLQTRVRVVSAGLDDAFEETQRGISR
jgi:pyruvate/2-oxoglutarate dehydrogenase complex dihydrolipoamide acyltransferase (E2) component